MRVPRRHRLLTALVLLLVGASTARAQDEESDYSAPWRLSYFPFLSGGANDGPVISMRLRYWQPAEYEDRVTANGAFDAAAGFTFQGSRYIGVRFSAPQLVDGWRLDASAFADRQARFGYYGLGNDTEKNDDLVTEEAPYVYRVRRSRFETTVELTRRIRGPFQVALRGDLASVRFRSLPGPSVFTADFGDEVSEGDVAGRVALVYDTRDVEYNTQRGLLLEVGAQVGSGGDGYTRLYSVLRGYASPRAGTVVALRLMASGMGGTPTLNARYELPTWEDRIQVLGGEQSHRPLDTGRLAGKGTLSGNLEVRHDVLNLGDLGAITLLAFADAGRVFEEESFRLTTEDMKVGGGGGFALRIMRSTIFTFNFAGGPDGYNFEGAAGWMF